MVCLIQEKVLSDSLKESIFFKKNQSFKKIRQTPQLFVNGICRNGKRLVFKSILKKISYESVFFNAANRI
jgi:hypothetical protein